MVLDIVALIVFAVLIVDPAAAFDSHEQPAWLKRGEQ